MEVPFLSLASDWEAVRDDGQARIARVLDSQVFVLGPETVELESALSELAGTGEAVACSSGTDALFLALLGLGVGPGDAVLLPALSFFATAGAVVRAGARPVFVDIDPATFNSGAREFARVIEAEFEEAGEGLRLKSGGARLAALMPVHLNGRAAELAEITELAKTAGAVVVEDAAQAIGARSGTRSVGSVGQAGCFSFYPTKNIGGAGDGGAVVTDSGALAKKLRALRVHGSSGEARHELPGINARMGELQAAVINAKLGHLAEWTEARRRIACRYDELLAGAAPRITLPAAAGQGEHVYHQYTVRVAGDRDSVVGTMEGQGIATAVFYPLALHQQPALGCGHVPAAGLEEAERAAGEVLCLPIYPALGDEELVRVSDSLIDAVGA